MSGDGSKLVIVNNGVLYTSTNTGASWTAATGLPVLTSPDALYPPSVSYDGSKMMLYTYVSASAGGYIYTSSDGGATFTMETGPG